MPSKFGGSREGKREIGKLTQCYYYPRSGVIVCMCEFALREVSVLAEPALGQLPYSLTDASRRPFRTSRLTPVLRAPKVSDRRFTD